MGLPPPSPPAIVSPNFKDSIGDITMLEDGTLVFRFRVEIDVGITRYPAVGDGLFRIKPDAPNYARALAYIGPLKPGEYKPMPRLGPDGEPNTRWD